MDVTAPEDTAVGGDWRFARRPFWVFSHFFALSVVALFIAFGFWQLDRLDSRQQSNALIEARITDKLELTAAPDGGATGDDLDYRSVTATVRFIEEDFVRVVNRSQGGAAGEHVVAIVELADGSPLAVNRGFVPSNADVELEPVPSGPVEINGWLRRTITRGAIGATDSGQGTRLPRLETERVAARLGRPLPPVWLQIAPDEVTGLATFPDPVALPPIDDGPHRSYAVQWFTFATLGVAFYSALLWRQSRGNEPAAPAPAISEIDDGGRTDDGAEPDQRASTGA
ncbi:MAG: SURF1 family protein [Acidimicrobiales bacterium]